MPSSKTVRQLWRRYEKLTSRIAEPGLLLVGTIRKRMDTRADPRLPGGKKVYGPYYQWTFKVDGKTRTVNLTSQQARTYAQAIRNHHKLQSTIREMRNISLKILESTTEGVSKRTRKT